jgi:hypothetical protein
VRPLSKRRSSCYRGADTDDPIFIDEALNARSFVFCDPYGNRLQVFQQCGRECAR